MKKKLCLLTLLASTFFANAQNVGIGTTLPKARLHVTDSSVLFSATGDIPGTQNLPPLQGAGRRMRHSNNIDKLKKMVEKLLKQ